MLIAHTKNHLFPMILFEKRKEKKTRYADVAAQNKSIICFSMNIQTRIQRKLEFVEKNFKITAF